MHILQQIYFAFLKVIKKDNAMETMNLLQYNLSSAITIHLREIVRLTLYSGADIHEGPLVLFRIPDLSSGLGSQPVQIARVEL